MKTFFTLFLSLALSSFTFAQDNSAVKLLSQVSTKVKSYSNIELDFSYKQQDQSLNLSQETKGSVALKGNKYRMELMGTTRIFDGQKLYSIIPEDEEINIASYNPESAQTLSPSDMLTFYENGYTAQLDIVQNTHGRKIQFVKLTPKKTATDIAYVLLGIDAQTKHISKMIQVFKDRSKVIVEVKSFKVNQPVSENMFKFNPDKYQGYYINRLD